ncbi:hypothetical protein HY373_02550 [Candidatus Berkelbacteria bacterium]|nr:hypothetical protein [Candidatus Berkelbacteria bacterium]MBI4030032.1 hypothetical protein [Candidatus Berkelbacteria bacterium]
MAIDLSKILPPSKTGWLALSPDGKKLVAKGRTLKVVLTKSRNKGVDNPTVFKMAPFHQTFTG